MNNTEEGLRVSQTLGPMFMLLHELTVILIIINFNSNELKKKCDLILTNYIFTLFLQKIKHIRTKYLQTRYMRYMSVSIVQYSKDYLNNLKNDFKM